MKHMFFVAVLGMISCCASQSMNKQLMIKQPCISQNFLSTCTRNYPYEPNPLVVFGDYVYFIKDEKAFRRKITKDESIDNISKSILENTEGSEPAYLNEYFLIRAAQLWTFKEQSQKKLKFMSFFVRNEYHRGELYRLMQAILSHKDAQLQLDFEHTRNIYNELSDIRGNFAESRYLYPHIFAEEITNSLINQFYQQEINLVRRLGEVKIYFYPQILMELRDIRAKFDHFLSLLSHETSMKIRQQTNKK